MFRVLVHTSTIAALVSALGAIGYTQQDSPSAPQPPMPRARYEQMWKQLSNWGRWGKDDQLGALNLITPAKRQQAFAEYQGGGRTLNEFRSVVDLSGDDNGSKGSFRFSEARVTLSVESRRA